MEIKRETYKHIFEILYTYIQNRDTERKVTQSHLLKDVKATYIRGGGNILKSFPNFKKKKNKVHSRNSEKKFVASLKKM